MQERRPVMLAILDGWGWREDPADNAVRQANTPNFDRLWAACPHALLKTSGRDVGLPDGQMGNSEVGHLNIGAGRVVMQDLPRIDNAIATGSITSRRRFATLIAGAEAERRHLPSHGPGLARRGAFASGPRRGAGRYPRRRRRAVGRARLHRWARHAAAIGGAISDAPGAALPSSVADRHRDAADTTRWTATSAGTASPGPITRSSKPRRRASPTPDAAIADAYAHERHRRVRRAVGDRRLRRHARTATACCASTSAPTASARFSARCSIRLRRLRAQARVRISPRPSA